MKTINEIKLQEKIGWKPHKGQEEILKDKSREILVCCGRRWGKSQLAAYRVVKKAIEPNKRIWIVAPNYELSKVVMFEHTIPFLSKILSQKNFSVQAKPFPVIKLANGTTIEAKSCEAKQGMLGKATDLVVFDEAAVSDEEIVNQYILPTVHERKGDIIYISTPRGLNWFYEKSLELKNHAYSFSSLENPYFPYPDATEEEKKEHWEKLKNRTPELLFRQEYEAQFITEAGLVFRGIEDIIEEELNDRKEQEPKEGRSYILGVDIARHSDFTALIVIDRATKKVVHIDRFKEMDYQFQKEKILTCSRKYNNAKIIIDSTGMGDSVASDLKRFAFVEEYPLYSSQKKQLLIDKLIIYINEKLIGIPKNEILINELKKYEVKVLEKSGKYSYSAPRSGNDDTVIALALAVWGLFPERTEDDNQDFDNRIMNEYE